ncbi:hypothetical protein PIB30_032318 [Stylosanthes scabra]|uniref:Uncharacterized protein n=1 Tax=Stylosanthes scabra TaxID=79078 RepID=A0ABU6QDJ4_9FABA|nr:hypothetical protein [Stylosanthes scabra]
MKSDEEVTSVPCGGVTGGIEGDRQSEFVMEIRDCLRSGPNRRVDIGTATKGRIEAKPLKLAAAAEAICPPPAPPDPEPAMILEMAMPYTVAGMAKSSGAKVIAIIDELLLADLYNCTNADDDSAATGRQSKFATFNEGAPRVRSGGFQAPGLGCAYLMVAKPQPLLVASFPWDRAEAALIGTTVDRRDGYVRRAPSLVAKPTPLLAAVFPWERGRAESSTASGSGTAEEVFVTTSGGEGKSVKSQAGDGCDRGKGGHRGGCGGMEEEGKKHDEVHVKVVRCASDDACVGGSRGGEGTPWNGGSGGVDVVPFLCLFGSIEKLGFMGQLLLAGRVERLQPHQEKLGHHGVSPAQIQFQQCGSCIGPIFTTKHFGNS